MSLPEPGWFCLVPKLSELLISQLSSDSWGLTVVLSPPTTCALETDVAADTNGDDDGVEVAIDDNSGDEDSPLNFLILLETSASFVQGSSSSLTSYVLPSPLELGSDDDSWAVHISVATVNLKIWLNKIIHCYSNWNTFYAGPTWGGWGLTIHIRETAPFL